MCNLYFIVGVYLNVMPMTPPGSGSDSDGYSPRQSPTPSPVRQVVFKSNHREINPATAIYSQPVSKCLSPRILCHLILISQNYCNPTIV